MIRHWQRLGQFPKTPFHIDPAVPHLRRHLFPVQFVEALSEIARRNSLGMRLDRDEWSGFQRQVFEAYRITVVPLLGYVPNSYREWSDSDWGEQTGHFFGHLAK
jgi:hypothetical protein